VLGVAFNGLPLRALPHRPVGQEPDASQPYAYYLEGADKVRLWPQSSVDVDEALTFYVALTPKQTVTHLPRIAATHFYDALYDGAVGRLMSQPAKAYTDTVRATYHLQRFRAAIGKYAGKAKGNFSGAPTWNFPKFGK
jgi:hypothetical protein